MSSPLRRFSRLAGLAAIILLVLWLGSFAPPLAILFLAVWVSAVCLDFRSTWQIYQLSPKKFSEVESNAFFVALYRKFGFRRSVPAFLALVEIPRLIFIALVCVPLVVAFFPKGAPPLVGFGAAAAAQGYAHLDGWWVNRSYIFSKKGGS